jgi:mycothiol synthase
VTSQAIYTNRLYADEVDRQAMAQLLVTSRPPGQLASFPSPHDLHEIVAQLPDRYQIALWEDDVKSITGFAVVDLVYNNFFFEIVAEARRSIATEVIEWATGWLRRVARSEDPDPTLDTTCFEDDAWRLAVLEQHGFVIQPVHTLTFSRSLSEPIGEPLLPAGFHVRSAFGEQEAEALTALHRAAFGTELMTVEERLAMMRVPDYDRALDLVAVAPDGSLVGYCFCSISHEQGSSLGHTDPVATHPGFQRLGLARALMLTGLRKLRERGAETAMLGTSSDNIAMQQAAESAGFQLAWSKVWLSKPIAKDRNTTRVLN